MGIYFLYPYFFVFRSSFVSIFLLLLVWGVVSCSVSNPPYSPAVSVASRFMWSLKQSPLVTEMFFYCLFFFLVCPVCVNIDLLLVVLAAWENCGNV